MDAVGLKPHLAVLFPAVCYDSHTPLPAVFLAEPEGIQDEVGHIAVRQVTQGQYK